VKTDLGQLHIATAGQGNPIILLHQTPRSWDEFRELIPLLAVEHRVIAMDMYGFGQSAKFPAPQTIEKYASGVIALADAMGLPTFNLLGHHTGGLVAFAVAAQYPDRVNRLIISAAPAIARFRESFSSPFQSTALHTRTSLPNPGVSEYLARVSDLGALIWAFSLNLSPTPHSE